MAGVILLVIIGHILSIVHRYPQRQKRLSVKRVLKVGLANDETGYGQQPDESPGEQDLRSELPTKEVPKEAGDHSSMRCSVESFWYFSH